MKQIASKLSLTPDFSQPIGRLFPLDLLKAMSITAVVSYHAIFVPLSTYIGSQLFIDVIFAPLRFCVPVFLTIYFLLFERGLANSSNEPLWILIRKRLTRLAIPTLFWFSLVAGLKLLRGNTVSEVVLAVLNGTIFTGAYYLLIVLQFVPIFILLRHLFNNFLNVFIIIFIQVIVFLFIHTILSQNFATQILTILKIVDRPLFAYWFVYMALGAYFWKNWSLIVQISTRIPIQLKIVILFTGYLLLAVEYRWLFLVTKGLVQPFDYVMISCILSVLVTFLCFASVQENQLPLPIKRAVITLSKYSLGIFCTNGIISQIFLSFGTRLFSEVTFNLPEILVIKFIGWGLLLALALGSSMLLDRIGLKACVR